VKIQILQNYVNKMNINRKTQMISTIYIQEVLIQNVLSCLLKIPFILKRNSFNVQMRTVIKRILLCKYLTCWNTWGKSLISMSCLENPENIGHSKQNVAADMKFI
jgi:hypothetical protein